MGTIRVKNVRGRGIEAAVLTVLVITGCSPGFPPSSPPTPSGSTALSEVTLPPPDQRGSVITIDGEANWAGRGVPIGPVSVKCNNGVTTYSGGGSSAPSSNIKVSYGGGAGAVITVVGAGGKAARTITVAAKYGKGTPPTNNPPTSNPPTGQPTKPPTGTSPNTKPEQPAPKPEPRDGHQPVTG